MNRIATTDTSTADAGLELAKWLGGAAAGALLMYMLDPDRGSARRAQSVAAVRGAGTRTSSALGNVWHGAGDRLGAMAGDAMESVRPPALPQQQLELTSHTAHPFRPRWAVRIPAIEAYAGVHQTSARQPRA